jgi:hypothetical protein
MLTAIMTACSMGLDPCLIGLGQGPFEELDRRVVTYVLLNRHGRGMPTEQVRSRGIVTRLIAAAETFS